MKSAVLLTDLRLHSLLIAAQLARDSGAVCVLSNSAMYYNDYGSYSSSWYKRLKVWVFSLFVSVVVAEDVTSQAESGICATAIRSSLISITKDSRADWVKYPRVYEHLLRLDEGAGRILSYLTQRKVDRKFVF